MLLWSPPPSPEQRWHKRLMHHLPLNAETGSLRGVAPWDLTQPIVPSEITAQPFEPRFKYF